MSDNPEQTHETADGPATTDTGLRCLDCEYNLTGITSLRCPECGAQIDWDSLRAIWHLEKTRPGTFWEQWPWYLKPVGFFVTALQVALMPWLFARRLQARPKLRWALSFLFLCWLISYVVAWDVANVENVDITMWTIGVACQMILQTVLFGFFLRPTRVKNPFRFWFAVTCYTSYPLLLESFDEPPYIVHGYSNIFPFSTFLGEDTAVLTSILYNIWWAGLAVIATLRLEKRHWWKVVLLVIAIPVLTYMSSYAGCYLGDKFF